MHCVVTAGPTAEPLDEVRYLTNTSTGRLGSGLAAFLMKQGCEVTLLRSRLATVPFDGGAPTIHEFRSTAELWLGLERLKGENVDAVFHVAAVSDFTFGSVYQRTVAGQLELRKERKFSTTGGALLAELTPTPKIIERLRGWFPRAWCVGWKYEMDGDRRDAMEAARNQLRRYGTHACVANGAAYGSGYGVVTEKGDSQHYEDARLLYEGLWERLMAFGVRSS